MTRRVEQSVVGSSVAVYKPGLSRSRTLPYLSVDPTPLRTSVPPKDWPTKTLISCFFRTRHLGGTVASMSSHAAQNPMPNFHR